MEEKIIAVIPSYEPPKSFISYIETLLSVGITKVLVVNDGSDKKYDETYDKISKIDGVTLLSYKKNLGKGYALKFAFNYIKNNFTGNFAVVTADCDGQHIPVDVVRIAYASLDNPFALVLGVRNFRRENVPFRSRFGNVSTRRLLRLLYGLKIADTQTGLRAFSSKLLPLALSVGGDRFEYEMNALIVYHKNSVPIIEINIETIYNEKPEEVSKRSHFKTFSDSFKVWMVLFKSVNRYIVAVILSLIIEVCIFTIGEYSLFKNYTPAVKTLLSTVTARVISSAFNYLVNFKFVFNGKGKSTVVRYYALWTILLTLSYLFTNLFGNVLGLPVVTFKLITDLTLSAFSYYAQTTWVFHNKQKLRI